MKPIDWPKIAITVFLASVPLYIALQIWRAIATGAW
jgi:hypothetical protein